MEWREATGLLDRVQPQLSFAPREAADWAAVLGDWRGDLVACCTGYLGASLSPLLAESMVVREALSWLHSLAVDRVVIKSDSCRLVQALLGRHACSADWGIYLADCLSLR
ncbi:hypothetical protein Gotur_009366 [Gossypium turneri]